MPPTTETSVAAPSVPAALEAPRNQTEVFAVHGADPEVLAYAMAKYSRSSLSMKDSLREISSQRAEQFLNTFYFQYGHRSIADLAHVAFAIERLSLLAAIVLVDEQRWDGQERSTRYQNFRKSGWYLPDFGSDTASEQLFRDTIDRLFTEYHRVSEAVFASLQNQVTKPADMKQESYDRTLRARAFDVARYLLPLATNTSLGQIVNARTLETQISRLLSSPLAEIRQLGARLQSAASGAAWNVYGDELAALQRDIAALDPALGERAASLLTREVKTAPTLVKYAAANDYQIRTREELRQAAEELLGRESIENTPLVDLIDDADSLETDLATTLLYGQCHYPYRQIRRHVAALSEARRGEIIDLGLRHRGKHDEILREFSAGQALRFDILMDIGGFRDMHRHRRCVQILQPFTATHGYAIPEGVPEASVQPLYEETMRAAHAACRTLAAGPGSEAAAAAQYILPLGTRNRALFKMDFAEALYISELRSAPQGHFSYRRVAWEMYRAVERTHPSLAPWFRVTDADEPIDLLKR
ncbi:MAG TPA: FAD-dependent thymidylate synthase [Acidobacteriaceae bacterium]|jgi:thymidylate synthase ThyX|nr:FAD-dependent thymidylate synthase [Acidobacteriaceae bacterium]